MKQPALSLDSLVGVLFIDIESASACDISLGAWAYSQHASTRVYCVVFGYATTATEPRQFFRWRPGMELPAAIVEFVRAGGTLCAFNAAFEQSMWANILAPRHGFPPLDTDQWQDLQAMGCVLNLPRSLDALCAVLRVKHQKDKAGAELMKSMAAPALPKPPPGAKKLAKMLHSLHHPGPWEYPLATPANLDRLEDYCQRDVEATADGHAAVAKLSVTELQVWRTHQRINARGVLLDEQFAEKLRRMASERQLRVEKVYQGLTFLHFAGNSPTALKDWLKDQGVKLPTRTRKKGDGSFHKTETTDALAVLDMLRDPLLPEQARAVLKLMAESSKLTSLAKLARVGPMVGKDGRLRYALQYCGAHTGRWSSSGLQLHNLPKNALTPASAEMVRELVADEDLDWLELFEARPLYALSQSLRSVVVAPVGRELIGADFSAVEARVCAWLAGQDDVVQFFHNYDDEKRAGRKPKKFYDYVGESIGCTDYHLSKIAALALQYGMGDVTFFGTAAKGGVSLTLLRARDVKKSWRLANSCIVQWWHALEAGAFAAVLDKGKTFRAGRVSFGANGSALFMRLPSGRSIRYWKPSIVSKTRTFQVVDDEGKLTTQTNTKEVLQFYKPSRGTMVAETTYGGKLAENATQATARELLAEGLVRLDGEGHELNLHVHDSCSAEVDAGRKDQREFAEIMAKVPAWGAGCPVAAEGWRDRRFKG